VVDDGPPASALLRLLGVRLDVSHQ